MALCRLQLGEIMPQNPTANCSQSGHFPSSSPPVSVVHVVALMDQVDQGWSHSILTGLSAPSPPYQMLLSLLCSHFRGILKAACALSLLKTLTPQKKKPTKKLQ